MLRTNFNGSPFLGVFSVATDSSLLVTPEVRNTDEIREELEVEHVYHGTLNKCSVLGSMAVANTNGVAVSSSVLDSEVKRLKGATKTEVAKVPGNINAIGNVVLENDNAALVSPELTEDARRAVEDALGVETYEGTVAGLNIVGSAGVATNRGVLVHPKASDDELELLEEIFGVTVDIGTVNYGTPLVGSGLVANSKGYVVGNETTGPELGRIEETLGFIE